MSKKYQVHTWPNSKLGKIPSFFLETLPYCHSLWPDWAFELGLTGLGLGLGGLGTKVLGLGLEHFSHLEGRGVSIFCLSLFDWLFQRGLTRPCLTSAAYKNMTLWGFASYICDLMFIVHWQKRELLKGCRTMYLIKKIIVAQTWDQTVSYTEDHLKSWKTLCF